MRSFNIFRKRRSPALNALRHAKGLKNASRIEEQLNEKVDIIRYEYKDDIIYILNEPTALYHIVHTTPKMEKLGESCSIIERGVMLDIGANIGLFAYYYKKSNPKVKAFLFEPDQRLHQIIKLNLSNFQDFELIGKAVGVTTGKVDFYINPNSSQTNSLIIEAVTPFLEPTSILHKQVEAISLHDFCLLAKIEAIDALKIDIQGGEYDVLKAYEDVLKLTREALVEVCFLMPKTMELLTLLGKYYKNSAPVNDIIMGADVKFFN